MYKPFDFDPAKKYPIILYVCPGPQTESVTKTFNPRAYGLTLAQCGLADKKAAVEQLARKNPFIDVNRVASGGTLAAGS